jgi:ATP-dependent exoDNAse (exonuclease V) alpha subunit
MSLYKSANNEFDEERLLENFKELLIEYNNNTGSNIPTEYNIELSLTQKRAFERFKLGDNLLILGSAGVGKSKLVKEFYKYTNRDDKKTMYLTSTTGISAYNLGGITINSFMGIGTGKESVDVLLKRLRYKIGIKNRIKMTDILVIDEISMMSADVFEKLNEICQVLRKSRKPFGGIQIILTGDFLQLETVFNEIGEVDTDNRLIIESELFKKMFKKNTINLKENFRQKNDNKYIDVLMRIRKGEQTEDDINILNGRLIKKLGEKGVNGVHLVSSNKKAQTINNQKLNEIDSMDYEYKTIYTKLGEKETSELLEKELRSQFIQKGIEVVKLRRGCRVLLIKNLDVSNGLVNGSIGTVEELLEDGVRVKFDNGITDMITRASWELELDNTKVICNQIPLMLAYSITCHRSQGISLDSAILDLADCFCNHMVYVALSRVRTLDGVFLKSFNHKKITVNKMLLDYVNNIE